MKVRLFSLLVLASFFSSISYSQNATLKGNITEDGTKNFLFGVNVIIIPENQADYEGIQLGTTSDFDGNYTIDLKPGTYNITYNYVGFKEEKRKISLKSSELRELNIALGTHAELIQEVVVSAGRYEQNLNEVTVSMNVLKPKMIENTNSFNMEQAINQIPGVDVSDSQPSIRSSSGWSYGAGSRVILLMDDLPIMDGGAGDVKWNFIPVENVSQVEVVKGASSVLYGSSAIGGVINIRSAYPTDKPQTKISYFSGVYGNPSDERLIWWERAFFSGNDSKFSIPFREELFYWVKNPMYGGLSFHHAQQFDNLDLSLGGNHFTEEGFRENNYQKRSRFNTNIRYRSKKVQGLAVGLNSNFMALDNCDFFMWASDTAAYMSNQAMGAVVPMQGFRVNIDPFAYYYSPTGSKYSVRTRFFSIMNDFPSDTSKNYTGNTYYGEYQYQTKIGEKHNLTAGLVNSYSNINSALFGDHFSNNFAGYGQIDLKIDRLSLTFGLRGEYFIVDTAQTESMVNFNIGNKNFDIPIKPVFRMGANYRLFETTFLRASIGQGYRFPSIAEKYTATTLGMVNIVPNPELTAETSWSGEAGFRQGFIINRKWQGFIDGAFFVQDINNMMEFTFGIFNPETFKPRQPEDPPGVDVFAFQSQNAGNARIVGTEVSLTAFGKLGPFIATVMSGYTYTNPYNRAGEDTTASTTSPMLKYRNKHSVKTDIDFEAKRLTFGFNFIYKSPVVNIDRLFSEQRDPADVDPYDYAFRQFFSSMILPGYFDYRIANADKPLFMVDARIGFKFSEQLRISVIVKNVMNTLYVGRPGDMLPPRRFEVQLSANF